MLLAPSAASTGFAASSFKGAALTLPILTLARLKADLMLRDILELADASARSRGFDLRLAVLTPGFGDLALAF